jgi:hypothetical protein
MITGPDEIGESNDKIQIKIPKGWMKNKEKWMYKQMGHVMNTFNIYPNFAHHF